MNENEMRMQDNGRNEQDAFSAAEKTSFWHQIFQKKLVLPLVAVLAVALAGVGASLALSSPLTLVAEGFGNSVAAIGKNDIFTLLDKYAEGGSVEVRVGLEELAESMLGTGIDATAAFKVYSDGEKGAALTADVEIGGEMFVDAALIASKTDLVLTSQKLFGEKAYGIDVEHAAENFENSVFGPNGAYSLGLESLDAFTESMAQSKEMEEAAAEIAGDFAEVVLESLKKNATVDRENEELSFNGETAKTTLVTVELDSEALAILYGDVVEYLYHNEEFKEFLQTYDEEIVNYLQGMDMISPYSDPSEFVEDFYDSLETAYDELEDTKEEIADSGVKLTAKFNVTKSGKQLVGMEIKCKGTDEKMTVSVQAGPRMEELREIKVKVDDGYSVWRMAYTVETDDKTEYAAELALREDGEEIFYGEIEWDKQGGGYELSFVDEYGDSFELEGIFEQNAQSATLTLSSISGDYYDLELDASVTLKASDKMPSAPNTYTEILAMEAEDIEDVLADAAANLMDAVYDLDRDVLNALQYVLWYL